MGNFCKFLSSFSVNLNKTALEKEKDLPKKFNTQGRHFWQNLFHFYVCIHIIYVCVFVGL